MNKLDTTANRKWLDKVCAAALANGAKDVSDTERATMVAVDARFPGERNERKRDGFMALFATMLAEEFDRVMADEAIADGTHVRHADGRVLRSHG